MKVNFNKAFINFIKVPSMEYKHRMNKS